MDEHDRQQVLRAYKADTFGPLGLPLPDTQAREIDALLKGLPEECAELVASGPLRMAKAVDGITFQDGERADVSIITTDTVDRDREVLNPKGIDFEHFKRTGGPVTWAHHYTELPVGRSQWLNLERKTNRLLAKTVYHARPQDWKADWFADAVWHLVRNGSLLGKSIGFIPTMVHAPTPDEIKKRPELAEATLIIDTAVLLEYAVAPIPANPEAIVQAVAKGLHVPDRIFDDCNIIVPAPPPGIDLKALGLDAETLEESNDEDGADRAAPEVVTRSEVRARILTARERILKRELPTILARAMDRVMGRH